MKKGKTLRSGLSIIFNWVLLLFIMVQFSNCKTEEPEKENVEEGITKVTVNFTPNSGGATISISAIDPDGDGPQDMVPEGDVVLEKNLEYSLELEFVNHLEAPPIDITGEIREEGDEHMIFFGWKDGLFFNPANGNINNNRNDVRYEDEDNSGLPVGLETTWTTIDADDEGEFRIVLKHQPDLKTTASVVNTGATDADITFNVVVSK